MDYGNSRTGFWLRYERTKSTPKSEYRYEGSVMLSNRTGQERSGQRGQASNSASELDHFPPPGFPACAAGSPQQSDSRRCDPHGRRCVQMADVIPHSPDYQRKLLHSSISQLLVSATPAASIAPKAHFRAAVALTSIRRRIEQLSR